MWNYEIYNHIFFFKSESICECILIQVYNVYKNIINKDRNKEKKQKTANFKTNCKS